MNKICKGLSASTLFLTAMMLGASPAAHATFVNSWNFTIDAGFLPEGPSGTVFSSGNGSKSVAEQAISWGSSFGPTDPSSNSDRSGLKLGNDPSSGTILTDQTSANTLSVTHVNNSISGNYATLLSTVISSTLVLTPADPAAGSFPPATIEFGIKFAETENSTPCAVTGPGTSVCNDIFILTSGLLNSPFNYDGEDYFLNILNVSGGTLTPLTLLPPNVCIAGGAPSSECLGFTTREGDSTTVQFAITITGDPITVPEPGVLSLFGLSLFALASVLRKSRK